MSKSISFSIYHRENHAPTDHPFWSNFKKYVEQECRWNDYKKFLHRRDKILKEEYNAQLITSPTTCETLLHLNMLLYFF
jgi:hypothetical protein